LTWICRDNQDQLELLRNWPSGYLAQLFLVKEQGQDVGLPAEDPVYFVTALTAERCCEPQSETSRSRRSPDSGDARLKEIFVSAQRSLVGEAGAGWRVTPAPGWPRF